MVPAASVAHDDKLSKLSSSMSHDVDDVHSDVSNDKQLDAHFNVPAVYPCNTQFCPAKSAPSHVSPLSFMLLPQYALV